MSTNLDLIEKVCSGSLESQDDAALRVALRDETFLSELMQQIQLDELCERHFNPNRSANVFCTQLFEKVDFNFNDSSNFVAEVLAKIEASKVPSLVQPTKDHPRLLGDTHSPTGSERVQHAFLRRQMSRRSMAGMAAAALAAFGLTQWALSPRVCARLNADVAGCRIQRQGDWLNPEPFMPLFAQDVIEASQKIIIMDIDGVTQIELAESSQLVVQKPGQNGLGSHYHLNQGRLRAQIAPQPREAPMVYTTRHARVVVLGTIIQLESQKNSTKVLVERGKIRWDNLMTQESTILTVGQSQEIQSLVVASNSPASLPSLQWKLWANGLPQRGDACSMPATPKAKAIKALCEFELDSKVYLNLLHNSPYPIHLSLTSGNQLIKSEWTDQQQVVLSRGKWTLTLEANCPAGLGFNPQFQWTDIP
jgi:ferric-dicitrate binding protein FerR (iron transport regulator)